MKRSLPRHDFRYIQRLLKETTGVVLDEGKEYLIGSRLGGLCYELEVELPQLITLMKTDATARARAVDLLLNHETSFFRDWAPFEGIRDRLLPELCEAAERRGERTLRIWCAACSSGQEPYSLAMLCHESLDLARWTVQIIASDVSPITLDFARRGSYSGLDVNRGLPSQALLKHFDQDGLQWRVKRHVRDLIEFKQVNLVEDWPSLPPFDLILLRNVLIYFDLETRRAIFTRLQPVLRRSGYLLLGSAELTMNLAQDFSCLRVGKAMYFQMK